jgi:hypothetical protein
MATAVAADPIRRIARSALAIGAAGSLALMMYAGRHNPSIPLIVLFTCWVASPFAALAIADRWVTRRAPVVRAAFYGVMFAVSIGSLLVYAFDALRPRPQAAFFYVIVPPSCWIVGGAVLAIVALLSRRTREH